MVVGPDTSRGARQQDYAAIDHLLRDAFPTAAEAKLVRALRSEGAMWFELIKPWLGEIGGYIALSRMVAPDGWACLAPLAVRPDWQNGRLAERNPNFTPGGKYDENYRGPWRFGTRLVRETIDITLNMSSKQDLPHTIVVLGKQSFYERCGFSSARAVRLTSPIPIEHMLIARPGDDSPEAQLIYPKAFGAV